MSGMRIVVLLLTGIATLAGCSLRSDLVDCGNGQLCPVGRTCVQLVAPDEQVCASDDQLAACEGLLDDDACELDGEPASSCQGGVCLPIVCGNGRMDRGEACDDANTITGDGTCAGDCRSNEACGNGLVDGTPLLNEQCDDGNLISNDGCSSLCAIESLVWTRRDDPVSGRHEAAAAYDAQRGRYVLFGGVAAGGSFDNGTYEWNGTSWIRIPTLISPSARRGHAMAYDAARRRVVMFGGNGGNDDSPLSDTWEWDGTVWTRRAPAVFPAARSRFGMVYDGARKRIVLFGGYAGMAPGIANAFPDDTWEWDGADWTQLQTTIPPLGRAGAVMAYDPVRAVTVLAGGYQDGTPPPRDTWELVGTTWTSRGAAPATLDDGGALAFDPAASAMVAWAGSVTWRYSQGTWTALAASGPGARFQPILITDPVGREVALFGGQSQGVNLGDTWRWSGDAWSLAPPAFTPPARTFAGAAYDPLTATAWVFGGNDVDNLTTNTLYSYSATGWSDRSGSGPSPRLLPGVAFDTALAQLVVFGGTEDSVVAFADTWLWNGAAWTLATPERSPPARLGPSMSYDPRRKRVVLFGGLNPAGPESFDDTWEWDGVTWHPISTANKPSPRALSAVAWDEARGVVVLSGGFIDSVALNDLWEYDGVDWVQVAATNPFARRTFAPLGYDPASRRLVLFGGSAIGGIPFDDTWTRSGAGWSEEVTARVPSARDRHVTFPAASGVGVCVFGGVNGGANAFEDTGVWSLQFENTQPRELCTVNIDNDGDGRSGCDDQDCWARCTPLCPPGAPCDPAASRCGDNVCNAALENCRMCPGDCACVAACGDSFCDAGETVTDCPGDCSP
jgi:cysteine-rich repeat protein